MVPFAASETGEAASNLLYGPANVDLTYDEKRFQISDDCGGIALEHAKKEVFRFGHSKDAPVGQLGVYGIGLKRAIFKLGNHITVESRTSSDGFRMDLDVPSWSESSEWTLPLEVIAGTGDPETAGTKIIVESYRDEVAARFKSGTFAASLNDMIARTYCLFLNRYVVVRVNGHKVEPDPIPLGSSKEVNVAKEEFDDHEVKVTIYAGLAARNAEREWVAADAGWYVACNGRLVVASDRTELTGWGAGMATFVPKYRGFIGMLFFYSLNPLLLPWTTTKRGLNQESLVFQRARGRMAIIARPVLTFLDNMYSSSETEKDAQREIAAGITSQDIRELSRAPVAKFATAPRPVGEPTVRVQYDAKLTEMDRIKKCLGHRSWPASKIGRYTFQHYLDTECPE